MGCLGWVASLPAAPPMPTAAESKNLGEAKDVSQKLPLPDLAIDYVTITPQNPTQGKVKGDEKVDLTFSGGAGGRGVDF